ncbi:hypothetical protein [Clostridium kluyveri]|uniref:hypothetical protein n=1 Tax=Clostridium kluyveri TaxID=1534 RepID=UPI0022475F4D|nr:hypothetical protein [Clostridium kluyveri]UZQ48923.1 hypothetical protein OP486_13125 [Clostridium kluyveri]
MQITRSNTLSNLQTAYGTRQAGENISKSHSNHNMTKMSNQNQMDPNCNMKGMHNQISSTESKNTAKDSNLGLKLDIKA